jgi:hypothetical protein
VQIKATPLPDWDRTDPPATQGEPQPSPEIPEEDLAPSAAPELIEASAQQGGGGVPPAGAPNETTPATQTQPPPDPILPAPGERARVSFSDETPREILAREGVTQQSFELAPDPSRASPMAVGASLELRTPDGALFTVRAKEQIRAQAYLADSPPSPLPDGLVPHGPIYVVRASPDYVQANTAVVIRVQEAAVPGLKLYVLDRDQGWIPLPGQRSDPASGTFSGIDFGVRAYALLAPR